MIQPTGIDQSERDERLGEAIEAYLALAEGGHAPDPEAFASGYPELAGELREALQGLALVQGLVGASGDGSRRLEAGRRVAGYRIVRELGRGGMGVVYEAVHVDLDRPVALKVLGAHAAPDSNSRRRFLNEAKTAAALHHTHIVPVFDVGQVGGLCYYAMQRIEGSGLDCVLKAMRRGRTTAAGSTTGRPSAVPSGSGSASPMPAPVVASLTSSALAETGSWGTGRGSSLPRERPDDEPTPFEPPRGSSYYRWVARLGRQAAEALAHAHRRGVIHRDIKPSNLLVDARGTIWVADFGLARRLTDPSLTQTDSALGTPRYMSPEQADARPIDGRTDIYSLGATLYELLALRPPFDGRTSAELARQIGEREAVSPRRFDPRLPRDLETIVLKAMAKRPGDRYETAAALADDLERFLKHEPVRARRIGPLGRVWRFARRHPSLTAVSVVATIAVLSTAAVAYVRVVQERDRALAAEVKAQGAKIQAEMANLETQAAMRKLLLSQAALVRASTVPNRRERGLALVAQAARSGPDPTLRAQLRDEAVQFLALRDIEARGEFPVGRTWGIAFGAEGRRLATVSADGAEFQLWDVEEHEPVPAHPLRPGSADPESENPAPHFPPGGPRLGTGIASAGPVLAVVRPDGRGVRLFDATTGSHLRDALETVERPIVSLFATSDGRRLITVERAGGGPERGQDASQVHLWEAREREAQPLATLGGPRPENLGRGPSFPLVAVGPDNAMIATAWMGAKDVMLWSAEDGRLLGTIATPAAATALALGPEGQLAVAGGGTISLWQAGTGQPLPGLSQHQGFVRAMRFSPDRGSLLAVAGLGSGVEVWDVASGTLVAALKTPDVVQDLDFAPGGPRGDRLLVAASGASASAWAVVEPAARTRVSGFDRGPSALAFGPDDLLAVVSRIGASGTEVRLWDTDHCPTTAQSRDESRSATVEFDGRGRLAVIDAESIRWFQPPGDEPVAQAELPILQRPEFWTGPRGFIQSVARSADGRTLALARASEILLWSAADPDRVRPLRLPDRPQFRGRRPTIWRDLVLAPDGDRLYLVGSDRHVHAWAIEGDRARDLGWTTLDVEVARSAEGRALALSPDGATLALADRSGDVVLLDTARGTVRHRLPRDDGEEPAGTLAFSPRGHELAVGTRQGTVRLWSLDAGRVAPLVRLPGHRGAVTTLAYDAQGDRLAAGGEDKAVDVWSLDRVRSQLRTLGLGW